MQNYLPSFLMDGNTFLIWNIRCGSYVSTDVLLSMYHYTSVLWTLSNDDKCFLTHCFWILFNQSILNCFESWMLQGDCAMFVRRNIDWIVPAIWHLLRAEHKVFGRHTYYKELRFLRGVVLIMKQCLMIL